MLVDTKQEKKKVSFDPTVNLGHLLTFVGFLIAGAGAWSNLNTRLAVIEEKSSFQRLTDATQDQRANEAYASIKETLGRIDRTNERISERLDKLGTRP